MGQGLAIPFTRNSGNGAFFAKKDKYDVLWSNILTTLFTATGSRVMRADLGSRLPFAVFDPADEVLERTLKMEIPRIIKAQVPEARILEVKVTSENSTDLHLSIKFMKRGDTDEDAQVREANLKRE